MEITHVLKNKVEAVLDNSSRIRSHFVYKRIYGEEYKRLKNNVKYKNKYLGERCFILGNGPSLKYEDLSVLQDEYVFTCNFFDKCENYEKVRTNFHFYMDPVFVLNKEDTKWDKQDILTTYQNIGQQGAEVFLPIQASNAVKDYSLDSVMKINYLACWGDVFRWKNTFNGDITKQIPGYATVVQTAIHVAVYMGFKEIYLLGCDNTYLLSLFKGVISNKQVDSHAYSACKNEIKEKKQLVDAGLTQATYGQYAQFYGYDYLERAFNGSEIKIINCTKESLLTIFPKSTLQEVIKENYND